MPCLIPLIKILNGHSHTRRKALKIKQATYIFIMFYLFASCNIFNFSGQKYQRFMTNKMQIFQIAYYIAQVLIKTLFLINN